MRATEGSGLTNVGTEILLCSSLPIEHHLHWCFRPKTVNEHNYSYQVPSTTRTRTNEIRSAKPIRLLGLDRAGDSNHDYTWQWEQTLDLKSRNFFALIWNEGCFSNYRFFWLTLLLTTVPCVWVLLRDAYLLINYSGARYFLIYCLKLVIIL